MKKVILVLVMVLIGGYWVYTHYINPAKEADTICQIVLVGAHANAAAPDLQNEEFRESLKEVYKSNGEVHFISVEGSPKVILKESEFGLKNISGLNDDKIESMAKKQVDKLLEKASGIKATSPEVDYIQALHIAGEVADSSHCKIKRVTILGSLLNTTGVLSYADNSSLLQANPKDVANTLKENKATPNLNEIESINIYGACSVASPQVKLSYNQADTVIEQYRAIFKSAGVKNVDIHTGVSTEKLTGYKNLPRVTAIPIPDDDIDFSGVVKFGDDKISFVGDTATFVDASEAEKCLQPVASYLNKDTGRRVLICGTTASGSENFCTKLSCERAEAVRDVLISKGVEENQVSCMGLGFTNKWHIKDLDVNGNLIEGKAKENRAVYIIDRDSDEAKSILN